MLGLEDYRRIAGKIALGGAKTPHNVSNPVFAMVDGKPCACFFVYTAPYESVKTGVYGRPCEWVSVALDGKEVVRHNTTDDDFSDAPFDDEYLLRDGQQKSQEELESAYAQIDGLFLRACNECRETGKADSETCRTYLDAVMEITPAAYRRFYKDLAAVVR